MSDLEKIIKDQRQELKILNNRCRLLNLQLKVVRDIDYYKSKLMQIAPNKPYKLILSSDKNRREVESIFNKPFKDCLPIYEEMLNIRNSIVHKYTSSDWKNNETIYNRKYTNKSLSELVKYEY